MEEANHADDASIEEKEHPFFEGLEDCIPYSYIVDKEESTTAMTILHNNPAVKAQEADFTKNPAEITLYVDPSYSV